jgi:hypothetical protein
MRTRAIMLALAAGAALVAVAAPAAADPTLACTMSMPPRCEAGTDIGSVTCTMSMPPDCRTG